MIITRSPLRISLGGGGTDLASYYEKHEGFLISAAIDKYVYITLHQTFTPEILLKYSKMECVNNIGSIEHPIIKEVLRYIDVQDPHLEICSMADIPAGTGLGSSSAFTCALLKALHLYKKETIHSRELAEEACYIEINILKEPIGKQDQYASACGGINTYIFHKNGKVDIKPLKISEETLYSLEDNLLLFFTGYSRQASSILKEQDDKSKIENTFMIDNLHYVKDIGYKSQKAFESGDLEEFAHLMNEHWQYKKQRSGNMSNSKIDEWYNIALNNGALGGKLIGAGGGGFLMFYSHNNVKLRHAMAHEGLKELRFKFDFYGTI